MLPGIRSFWSLALSVRIATAFWVAAAAAPPDAETSLLWPAKEQDSQGARVQQCAISEPVKEGSSMLQLPPAALMASRARESSSSSNSNLQQLLQSLRRAGSQRGSAHKVGDVVKSKPHRDRGFSATGVSSRPRRQVSHHDRRAHHRHRHHHSKKHRSADADVEDPEEPPADEEPEPEPSTDWQPELEDRVETLEGKEPKLVNRVQTLEGRQPELVTRVKTLESRQPELVTRMTTLEGRVAKDPLKEGMQRLESRVAALESVVEKLKADQSQLIGPRAPRGVARAAAAAAGGAPSGADGSQLFSASDGIEVRSADGSRRFSGSPGREARSARVAPQDEESEDQQQEDEEEEEAEASPADEVESPPPDDEPDPRRSRVQTRRAQPGGRQRQPRRKVLRRRRKRASRDDDLDDAPNEAEEDSEPRPQARLRAAQQRDLNLEDQEMPRQSYARGQGPPDDLGGQQQVADEGMRGDPATVEVVDDREPPPAYGPPPDAVAPPGPRTPRTSARRPPRRPENEPGGEELPPGYTLQERGMVAAPSRMQRLPAAGGPAGLQDATAAVDPQAQRDSQLELPPGSDGRQAIPQAMREFTALRSSVRAPSDPSSEGAFAPAGAQDLPRGDSRQPPRELPTPRASPTVGARVSEPATQGQADLERALASVATQQVATAPAPKVAPSAANAQAVQELVGAAAPAALERDSATVIGAAAQVTEPPAAGAAAQVSEPPATRNAAPERSPGAASTASEAEDGAATAANLFGAMAGPQGLALAPKGGAERSSKAQTSIPETGPASQAAPDAQEASATVLSPAPAAVPAAAAAAAAPASGGAGGGGGSSSSGGGQEAASAQPAKSSHPVTAKEVMEASDQAGAETEALLKSLHIDIGHEKDKGAGKDAPLPGLGALDKI